MHDLSKGAELLENTKAAVLKSITAPSITPSLINIFHSNL